MSKGSLAFILSHSRRNPQKSYGAYWYGLDKPVIRTPLPWVFIIDCNVVSSFVVGFKNIL